MLDALAEVTSCGGIALPVALAANDKELSVGAGNQIAHMHDILEMLGDKLICPNTVGIDNHVKASQIFLGKIHRLLLNDLRGNSGVVVDNEHSHVVTALDGLFDDRATIVTICGDYCDLLCHAFSFPLPDNPDCASETPQIGCCVSSAFLLQVGLYSTFGR